MSVKFHDCEFQSSQRSSSSVRSFQAMTTQAVILL